MLTHEHVMCTLDAGGDAPQLTSKEARPTARYARQSAGAFVDQTPRFLGRDPVGESQRRLAAPSHPERPWSLVDRCPPSRRTDEKRGRRTTRVRAKRCVCVLFRLLCCFNRPSPLLYMRGLDFLYKVWTQISVQRVKNTSQIRTQQNLPESALMVGGSTAFWAPVVPLERYFRYFGRYNRSAWNYRLSTAQKPLEIPEEFRR